MVRQTSDERDDRQSSQMGEIRATLENAARDRVETRDIMKGIQNVLTEIQIAISRMVAIQEETGRRLTKIDEAIGDDKAGLTGRLTKVEGMQLLDQSEISDIDKRVKNLEDTASSINKRVIGALVAACLALAAFTLRLLKIVP